MKKEKDFFVIYLPVSGEIFENDIIYRKDLTIDTLITAKKHKFTTIEYYNNGNFQKVALFLCSRNINIGDSFLIPEVQWKSICVETHSSREVICTEISEEVYHYEGNCNLGGKVVSGVFKSDNPYKIIGEISPDVKWLKKGSEFKEGDETFMLSGFSLENGEWFLEQEEPYSKIQLRNKPETRKNLLSFKCLKCNTFV